MKIKSIKKSNTQISFEILIDKEWPSAVEEAQKKLTSNDECECESNHQCEDKCNCHENQCHCDDKCNCECNNENNEISKNEIYNCALEILDSKIFELVNTSEEYKENKQKILELPGIFVKDANDNECELEFIFDVKPEIKLPSFDDLKLEPRQEIVVDDKDVDAELQYLVEQSKKTVEIQENRELQNGDIADIDFDGKIDGESFEGGSSKNYELTIGSNHFIPGFEEQLIGMKKGDTKKIDVTFPNDYFVSEYANKKAVFDVKLNAIKKEEIPTLNDDFVKAMKIHNVTNVDQLKAYTKVLIQEQKEIEQEGKLEKKVMDYLSTSKISHEPKIMKSKLLEYYKDRQIGQLAQYGISFEQFIEMSGQDKDKIMAQFDEEATKQVIASLAIGELIHNYQITVTDNDINNEYNHVSKMYNIDLETIKEKIPLETLKTRIQTKKLIDRIIANAQKKDK